MMHAVADPAYTMRAPVLAVPGTTYYRYSGAEAINLSHCSTTCIDPSNPDLLWTYQAYGNSTVDKQWCTAWASFQLDGMLPPLVDLGPGQTCHGQEGGFPHQNVGDGITGGRISDGSFDHLTVAYRKAQQDHCANDLELQHVNVFSRLSQFFQPVIPTRAFSVL
jgi:hypothetical protein